MTDNLYRRKRIGSASSTEGRSGSAGTENRNLRNTISLLQQELVQSKAETQKVTDQLNCLITLVKRAWVGDNAAAVHVGNIVGVAPPDFYEDEIKEQVTSFPKSRALNNWAVLSIGLLNKEYKRVEQALQAKQRRYLQNRQAYLDEQLLYNRHLQAKELLAYSQQPPPTPVESMNNILNQVNGAVSGYRPPSGKRISSAGTQRPKSGTSRVLGRPLYRDSPQTPPTVDASSLTWADLVQNPTGSSVSRQKSSNEVFSGLSRLKSTSNGSLFQESYREECVSEMRKNYADPSKYHVFGLYDSEAVVASATSSKKRPTSAAKQRSSDAARARPKSSVLPKSERPMKYETTRSVSAQVTNRRHSSNNILERPANGIAKDKVFLTLSTDEVDTDKSSGHIEDIESAVTGTMNGNSSEALEYEPEKPCIDVKIKRPQHVDAFVDDLKTMEKMESDFKIKLDALQKKLGITDGLI